MSDWDAAIDEALASGPAVTAEWDGESAADSMGPREAGPVPEVVIADVPEDITLQQLGQMIARISTVYPDQLMVSLELLAAKINAVARNQVKLAERFDALEAKVAHYEGMLPEPGTLRRRLLGAQAGRRAAAPRAGATAPAAPGPAAFAPDPSPMPRPARSTLPLALRPPARAIPHEQLIPKEAADNGDTPHPAE